MTLIKKQSFFLFILVLACVFYGWKYSKNTTNLWSEMYQLSPATDVYITDVYAHQFDEQGQLQRSLQAPIVQRLPLTHQHQLQKPRFFLIQNTSSQPMSIQAEEALTSSDGQDLMFNHHVILQQDGKDPMNMQADHVVFNQKTHHGIYTGHLLIQHGAAHIQAHEATSQGDEHNRLIQAEIKGKKKQLVHYWARRRPSEPMMHAYAETMIFYPDRHLIQFWGHARVEQNHNSFAAPMISYDTLHQHIISAPHGIASRTTIIIHPEHYS